MASASGPIEVVLGERIDPANYWIFLVSDLYKIHDISKNLDQINIRGQMLRKDELKPGKLVTVRIHNSEGSSWYRAEVQAVTLSVDTCVTVDVFLIDYGVEKKNAKFPNDFSHLIDDYHLVDPFAFKYNLNGIIPNTKTIKFEPFLNKNRPFRSARKKEWSEHAESFTHCLTLRFSRAWIHMDETKREIKSGILKVEIKRKSLKYFKDFKKVLVGGGYTPFLPIVDVNQALVTDKLALSVESIKSPESVGLAPKLSRYPKPLPEDLNMTPQSKTGNEKEWMEQKKTVDAMKKLDIIQNLEQHLNL